MPTTVVDDDDRLFPSGPQASSRMSVMANFGPPWRIGQQQTSQSYWAIWAILANQGLSCSCLLGMLGSLQVPRATE